MLYIEVQLETTYWRGSVGASAAFDVEKRLTAMNLFAGGEVTLDAQVKVNAPQSKVRVDILVLQVDTGDGADIDRYCVEHRETVTMA